MSRNETADEAEAAYPPASWQPIESLPRHGRVVVLVSAKWGEESLVVAEWDEYNGVLSDPSGREWFGDAVSYTHWVELPPILRYRSLSDG